MLLSKAPGINFIGNIEARQLPGGGCDVAVCDGFTGNIILKLTEGFGEFFSGSLRAMFTTNTATKLSALLLQKQLRAFKGALNYKEYGGAPFWGCANLLSKHMEAAMPMPSKRHSAGCNLSRKDIAALIEGASKRWKVG
jgi:glycerol-3-phosphate acyltransferase PlsX